MQMFQPINEKILVKPMKEPQRQSGILLPESSSVEIGYGEIVAMGDGAVTPNGDRITPAVSVGQIIYYEMRGIKPYRDLGLHQMTERQIIGVVAEPKDSDILPMA